MATKTCNLCESEVDTRGFQAHQQKHAREEPPSTTDDIAAAIAAMTDGINGEPFAAGAVKHRPAMVTHGVEAANDGYDPREIAKAANVVTADGRPRSSQPRPTAPTVKAPPLDPITRAMGAQQYRAGTDNRYDWCREFSGGPRHTFTRLYFRENVLLDIYQTRTKAVEAEVAVKSASIKAHNETAAEPLGYIAVFVGDVPPTPDVVARALAGEVVGFALEPAIIGGMRL